jgi:hypothetical protein
MCRNCALLDCSRGVNGGGCGLHQTPLSQEFPLYQGILQGIVRIERYAQPRIALKIHLMEKRVFLAGNSNGADQGKFCNCSDKKTVEAYVLPGRHHVSAFTDSRVSSTRL